MRLRNWSANLVHLALGAAMLLSSYSSYAATLKPLVAGRRGVVAAGHPLVAEAGLRILEKGGNAVDAGVASVFAASVVEMTSFGAGGECPILIKLKNGPVVAINGDGIAPELATVEFYEHLRRDDPRVVRQGTYAGSQGGIIPSFGPLSAIVPGAMDSLLLALEKYGTKSLAEVIQPAIELAQGFPLNASLEHALARGKPLAEKWPATSKVYMPDGRPPKEGEIFVQADLARTFETLARVETENAGQGRAGAIEAVRNYFYRGPIAKRISDFCKEAGCLLREEDFAALHARVEEPLSVTYRGVQVYKCGFWTQGPVFLENLNLLEGFDLKAMKHNSADYVHTVVEAEKLGYADRDAYYGDPDFAPMPAALISKEYANLRRPLIDPHRASAEHIPGDPVHMAARAPEDFALRTIPAPQRRAPGHHLRECDRSGGKPFFRHAQRRVDSCRHRRRYGNPSFRAGAAIRPDAGASQSNRPAQKAAPHPDALVGPARRPALAGFFHSRRRQPGPDPVADIPGCS